MMGWALAILFSVAILLLILSFYISKKASHEQKKESNSYYISVMKEINSLQEQTRSIELDTKIIAHEAGLKSSVEERLLMRELLDLYSRQYSLATMAAKTNLSESDIKEMLAPYIKPKLVRGKAANDS